MSKLSPIVLFAYNRLDHLKQTISSLQKNNLANQSDLFIYCDGAKDKNDEIKVNQVQDYLATITGFKSITLKKNNFNKGLANSIIDGVSEIVNKYEKVIVLEDDLVTSPYFLEFMNDGLDFYKNNETVISIHGYIYPVKEKLQETFFIKGADCWGWATWKRGWDLFEHDGKKLLDQLENQNLTYQFDYDNSYPFTQMLKDQIDKKNNSWAIKWYASAFLKNKLTLYPSISLVQNIGLDNSGTHCGDTNKFRIDISNSKITVAEIDIVESLKAKKAIKKFLKPKKNIFSKIFKF